MRIASDKLCADYGLSVLKHEKQEDRYNKFATSSLYKELMKDSIDYAIVTARNYEEFIKILQDLDYIVNDRNNVLSIRREPYKRNTRIERQFGNDYSKESIYKSILETQLPFGYVAKPYLVITRTRENYEELKTKVYPKKGSFAWLFLHYMKLFHPHIENVLKSNSTRITPETLHAIKEINEFSNRIRFLCKHNLETDVDVMEFKKSAYQKLSPLKSERENLWRKHKRVKTEDKQKEIEEKIVAISKELNPITEEIRLCDDILKRAERIRKCELKQKLEEERKSVEVKKKKDKNRAR